MLKIEFNTREYEFSHGHKPRGRGSWAFFPNRKTLIEQAMWTPSMTYGEAKRWIAAKLRSAHCPDTDHDSIELFVGS